MPEQEKHAPRPGEELVLERDTNSTAAVTADSGAAKISPMIILPPIVITVLMSFCLALVYGITKEPIAAAKRADKTEKLVAVMPQFNNDTLDSEQALSDAPLGKPGNVMLYTGTVDGTVTGFGITSAVGTGYSGYFSIVFGLDTEGKINAVKILESMETPGLGSKAGQPAFIDQFIGKNLDNFKFAVSKDGGDVDAITGATITSRAVTKALDQGLESLRQWESENGGRQAGGVDVDAEVEESAENNGDPDLPGGGA